MLGLDVGDGLRRRRAARPETTGAPAATGAPAPPAASRRRGALRRAARAALQPAFFDRLLGENLLAIAAPA